MRFVGIQGRLKEDEQQLQEVSRTCVGFRTDSPGWQPVLTSVKSAGDMVDNEICIPRRAEQAWQYRGDEHPGQNPEPNARILLAQQNRVKCRERFARHLARCTIQIRQSVTLSCINGESLYHVTIAWRERGKPADSSPAWQVSLLSGTLSGLSMI